jgi:hypothetical protein
LDEAYKFFAAKVNWHNSVCEKEVFSQRYEKRILAAIAAAMNN